MNKGISLIVPTTTTDISKILSNKNLFFSLLPIEKIFLICNTTINIEIDDCRIHFIDENKLIEYDAVKKILVGRLNTTNVINRTGWYLQQFLKMSYARICTDEFYLLWDSDTIPLKPISLFNDIGKPFLDYKSEYHKPYFDTISHILPGYNKIFGGSFIAEHMLINTKHMRQLLDEIENNELLPGQSFYEKIISAVSVDDISKSGFSEFETYGTFVYKNYHSEYELRQWCSLRFGGMFFTPSDLKDKKIVKWLSSYYHAISFEKGHYLSSFRGVANNTNLIKYVSPLILDFFSIFVRIKRRFLKIM